MRPAVVLLALLLVAPSLARAGDDTFREAMTLLSQELIDEAIPVVERLEREEPGRADTIMARARLAYMQGRYDDVIARIDEARATGDPLQAWRGFEEQARSTREINSKFKKFPTSRGHFVIQVNPGVDEVLVPYADQALEAAYDAYGELFGYRPTEPVRVEIYPRVEDLAAVSTLKVSDIQNSGTIALCKYNRLMITSPRDLLYGYDWLDTLAHEYIHFVITKRSRNEVPIWLQEGLAKFFENRWREPKDGQLEPSSQDLLSRSLEKGKLITFEQMSPSMAKLPTQEDAALAFAEVYMAMGWLKGEVGMPGINRMIDVMRDGGTDRDAIETVLDTTFDRFEADWRRSLAEAKLVRTPSEYTKKLYFRSKDKTEDELLEIGAEKARKHTYLGDRLRAMERFEAAVREYNKAVDVVGDTSPVIQSKLGAALLALGEADKAVSALQPPLRYYPDYVLIWLHLGRAHLLLNDHAEAARHLEAALRLNPFDPDVHRGLIEAYTKLGRTADADREKAQLALLGG